MKTSKYINYVIDNKVLYKLSILLLLIIIAMVFLGLDPAHASTGGSGSSGESMPWEGPLTAMAASFKGPVAFSIALIGMVICGGMLVFGGELGDFARRAIMLMLAISIMSLGTSLLTSMFGLGGAVII